jgi:hypothetical protein
LVDRSACSSAHMAGGRCCDGEAVVAFLAPTFLALAAFVGVPILLHLLRRKIGSTVEFPAVRYLARMEQDHSREIKLKNRFLLLLRVLAVLALAAAAARPIARRFGFGHAPMALAIVVDNSMSSGAVEDGRARFDSVRAETARLVGQLTADDRGWLVTADGRVLGGSPATLMDVLRTMTPLGARGDLALATTRALGLVRSGAPRTPVVALVSDGQRTALRSDSVVDARSIPVLALHVGGRSVANHAVVAAQPEPLRWTPGGTVSLAVAGPAPSKWRLALDGRTVARGEAPAAAVEAPARVTQKLASTANGWVCGSVELDADGLRCVWRHRQPLRSGITVASSCRRHSRSLVTKGVWRGPLLLTPELLRSAQPSLMACDCRCC